MLRSCSTAWSEHILPAYAGNEHRNKAAMDAFVEGGDQAIAILGAAMRFNPRDDRLARECYGLMAAVQESLNDAHSMRQSGRRWVRAFSLTDENKEDRRRDVAAWRAELDRLGVSDVAERGAQAGVALKQEKGMRPDGRPDIMHRALTWKGLVGFFCISRFLAHFSGGGQGDQSIAFIWLFLGVLFMVWWYETG